MSINKYNPTTGELELLAGGSATLYADAPIGTVQAYIGATAPDGWLICDGSAVSRTSYARLFELIGTNYGEGDGSTTFNLPDMRNRTVMGAGSNGNLHTVQEDATAKNGMQTFSAQGEGKTGGAGTHTHAVLAYTGAKANIANVYPRSIIASNMETTLGGYTQNADFGGTSMQYLQDAGLHFHYVGLRSDDPETRPKNIRMNWIIKALQVGAPADFMDAVDEAVADLRTVSTMPVTKQGNYINGTNFHGVKVGKVATIEINGDTSASIPWDQITTVGVTTRSATPLTELKCTSDMVNVLTGYDPNGAVITKWIPPYCRAWIDNDGNIQVYLSNPGSSATSYTGNLFIGGSYITQ